MGFTFAAYYSIIAPKMQIFGGIRCVIEQIQFWYIELWIRGGKLVFPLELSDFFERSSIF